METLPSPPAAPTYEDWLDHCAFTSRHRAVVPAPRPLVQQFDEIEPGGRSPAPATLTEKFESSVLPDQARPQRNIAGRQSAARTAAPARLPQRFQDPVLPARPKRDIPLIDGGFQPITESLPVVRQIRQVPDPLVAELRSFRQLSSPFLCPEKSRDTLPEYILFGLIVLLAVAWPILAMLGVMARS
jgi:hypothetical protein